MSRKFPKRATKAELAYIHDLEHTSAFELLDRGQAELVLPDDYPEPLQRFLKRERTTVHVRLTPTMKRRLEAKSRRTGIPVDELALRWIKEGMQRDAG